MDRFLAFVAKSRSRWWWWVVGGLVLLVIFAIAKRALERSGDELARLRHEHMVAQEEQDRARVDAQVMRETSQADAAQAKADALQVEVDALETTMQAARRQHAENLAAINRIRSWSDVGPR